MPTLLEAPPMKAARKAKQDVQAKPEPPKPPRDIRPHKRPPLDRPITSGQCQIPPTNRTDFLVSAAPLDLNELAGYFYDMSRPQLEKCWVACTVNALCEDMIQRELIGRTQASGLYRAFSSCLVVVRSRLIEER